MLKKIILFALLLLSFGAFAQDKIAYFSAAEVITAMPEYTQMLDSLKFTENAIHTEAAAMEDEYNRKYEAFMKEGDTLIEAIKIRRMQELRDLEQRFATYSEQSQLQLRQLQEQLLIPIQQKVKDAIQAVGAANNFLYILDTNAVLYVNPTAVNATDLVKKKLGL